MEWGERVYATIAIQNPAFSGSQGGAMALDLLKYMHLINRPRVWTGAIMMNPSGAVPSLTNMLFQLWTTPWCKRPHIGVVVLISFLHARAHTILVRRLSLLPAIPRCGRLKQNYPASGSPQAIACYTWPICPATAVNAATSTPVPGVLVPMRQRHVPSLSCGPASELAMRQGAMSLARVWPTHSPPPFDVHCWT